MTISNWWGRRSLSAPEALSAHEAAAAKAREIGLSSKFAPCSRTYNPVVFPADPMGERWVVYLFPGTTDRYAVPIGGSYRVDVDLASGEAAVRGYTRTCIELRNDPKAVGLMITHLLDAVPTDAHVFWSLWASKPIYVATPPHGTIWSVDGAQITLVERRTADR